VETLFTRMIREQNRCYHELYERLHPYVFEISDLASDPRNKTMLKEWAKEDARYMHRTDTEPSSA